MIEIIRFLFYRRFCLFQVSRKKYRNVVERKRGNPETRYEYLYSSDEISEFAEKILSASQKAPVLFAYFNNHSRAHAPRNAGDLIKKLQLPFIGFPQQGLPEKE